MSGIAGIIHFDGRSVQPGQIESMTQLMAFRGPDGISHWRKANVAFGHCMLRATPESLEETQPLANEDHSLVLVMDGRVDNWTELRRELLSRGAVLRNRSDAELVLRAYELWGDASPQHIDGDFAYVIWDVSRQQALAVRDRFGNKPFHYHWNGASLAFSTDLRPTLDLPWVPQALDLDTVSEYLAGDWYTVDSTLWQGLFRLPPAHVMRLSAEQREPHLKSYWNIDFSATLPCKTDQEAVEYYRHIFLDTVRRMSRSHRPLAFEVSGGLDSSAIFGAAASLKKVGQLPAPSLLGYTLDFSGDAKADELRYALAVGAHVQCDVRRVPPQVMPLNWYRERAVQTKDFADLPNGAMNLALLQSASDAGSRVLISGTGGDEWAGGHFVYRAEALAAGQWSALRGYVLDDVRRSGWRTASRLWLRHGIQPLLGDNRQQQLRSLLIRLGLRKPAEPPSWLSDHLRRRLEDVREWSRRPPPAVRRVGQLQQYGYLLGPYWQAAKGINDRRAAGFGLEWRQPFWSKQVVELAFSTPDHLRSREGQNKWLHRQAARSWLPDLLIHRRDKAEFSTTYRALWPDLRRNLEKDVLTRNHDWVVGSEILSLVDTAFTEHRRGADHRPPWNLFVLDALLDL